MSDDIQCKEERFVVVNESGQRLTKPLSNEEISEKLPKLQEAEGEEKLHLRQILEE